MAFLLSSLARGGPSAATSAEAVQRLLGDVFGYSVEEFRRASCLCPRPRPRSRRGAHTASARRAETHIGAAGSVTHASFERDAACCILLRISAVCLLEVCAGSTAGASQSGRWRWHCWRTARRPAGGCWSIWWKARLPRHSSWRAPSARCDHRESLLLLRDCARPAAPPCRAIVCARFCDCFCCVHVLASDMRYCVGLVTTPSFWRRCSAGADT